MILHFSLIQVKQYWTTLRLLNILLKFTSPLYILRVIYYYYHHYYYHHHCTCHYINIIFVIVSFTGKVISVYINIIVGKD